jgi:hypothetical protein
MIGARLPVSASNGYNMIDYLTGKTAAAVHSVRHDHSRDAEGLSSSQTPVSFNLDAAKKKIEEMSKMEN